VQVQLRHCTGKTTFPRINGNRAEGREKLWYTKVCTSEQAALPIKEWKKKKVVSLHVERVRLCTINLFLRFHPFSNVFSERSISPDITWQRASNNNYEHLARFQCFTEVNLRICWLSDDFKMYLYIQFFNKGKLRINNNVNRSVGPEI
jgi:hypothetical protein